MTENTTTQQTKAKDDDASKLIHRLKKQLETVLNENMKMRKQGETDSKLIMQLSKNLERVSMENAGLKDDNDRLNQRLDEVECEKTDLAKHMQSLCSAFGRKAQTTK